MNPEPTITVSVNPLGHFAQLSIEDNGQGLDENQREQAFERFWRGSDMPGGCGLGLSIVQGIAQRHDGQALLSPITPQGLRVSLLLPLVGEKLQTQA